jgi:hypothetical protein
MRGGAEQKAVAGLFGGGMGGHDSISARRLVVAEECRNGCKTGMAGGELSFFASRKVNERLLSIG